VEIIPGDVSCLRCAKDLLENSGLAVKFTNVIGMPFEKTFDYLLAKWISFFTAIIKSKLRVLASCVTLNL